MSKQLIERLRGFKDTPRTADNLCHEAADRIEDLERANQHLIMALADAEALEIGTAERCDALQADNARLRDVMYRIAFSRVGQCESIAQELFDREAWAAEALAATADLDGLILCHAKPSAWCQDVIYEMAPEFAFSWVETQLHDSPLYRAWEPK